MRKHHVFICSVLSVATVAAQQAAPGGAKTGTSTVGPSVSAAPTTESVVPVAVETPAPLPGPSSTPVLTTPPPMPASLATPSPLEVPAPIEPPTPMSPATAVAPSPIAPPIEPGVPASAVPGAPVQPGPDNQGGPGVPPPLPGTPGVPGQPATASAMEMMNSTGVHDFQNDDVGQVLRMLARQAKINVAVSDQVQGTITMRLESMTPMQALETITDFKNLIMEQRKGVYYIRTQAEKMKEATESASYTFSYAQAEKVLPLLATQIQSGVAPQFDQRTNTVYYREFKSNLPNIALFLETVDRPTQQVMIEARLVEVNANPRQSYGINWAGTVGSSANPQTVKYGGSGLGSVTLKDTTHVDPNTGLPIQVPTVTTLPNVPTSSAGASTGVTQLQDFVLGGQGKNLFQALNGQFAILTAPQMSATLRFLNEDSDAEFLANPRIVTANNLKADIKIIRQQPVPQLTFNQQTAQSVFSGFDNKEFGNTLEVTPTINKDDYITMLVRPEISNKVGDATFQFGGANVSSPIIDKRTLDSTVLIKSGETLAIGGLLQDEVSKGRTKVPVLGDIPLLGYAFQERVNARVKRNLLVFVTPTIIRQGYGTGLEDQVSGMKNSGEEYADPNGWRNNAKGAIRLKPTADRSIMADYPKPGSPPPPKKRGYHRSAPVEHKAAAADKPAEKKDKKKTADDATAKQSNE